MDKKRITTKEFKELIKAGEELPEDLTVCKAQPFVLEKADGDSDLTRTFTISTPSVDREGDRLLPTWELDNFNKGGSVLWGHDSRSTPLHVIAAPRSTWLDGDKLRSKAEFTPRDVNPLGFTTFRLIEFGALRSASVGFAPKEFEEAEDDSRVGPWGYPGLDFGIKELLEWSVVPVPANPEALVDAKAHGIDLAPLVSWSEEALDKGVQIVGVERDILEGAWKAAKPTAPVTVSVPEQVEPKEKPTPKAKDTVTVTLDTEEAEAKVKDLTDKIASLETRLADLTQSVKSKEADQVPGASLSPPRPPGLIQSFATSLTTEEGKEAIRALIDSAIDKQIQRHSGRLGN